MGWKSPIKEFRCPAGSFGYIIKTLAEMEKKKRETEKKKYGSVLDEMPKEGVWITSQTLRVGINCVWDVTAEHVQLLCSTGIAASSQAPLWWIHPMWPPVSHTFSTVLILSAEICRAWGPLSRLCHGQVFMTPVTHMYMSRRSLGASKSGTTGKPQKKKNS